MIALAVIVVVLLIVILAQSFTIHKMTSNQKLYTPR
jgi:hypothetical protein